MIKLICALAILSGYLVLAIQAGAAAMGVAV